MPPKRNPAEDVHLFVTIIGQLQGHIDWEAAASEIGEGLTADAARKRYKRAKEHYEGLSRNGAGNDALAGSPKASKVKKTTPIPKKGRGGRGRKAKKEETPEMEPEDQEEGMKDESSAEEVTTPED